MEQRSDLVPGTMKALGDYIGGAFLGPTGAALVSRNPAAGGTPVLETAWDVQRIEEACAAAAEAAPTWGAMSRAQRWEHLVRFRRVLEARREELAEAITLEVGKLRSEARAEAGALVSRFELVRSRIDDDLIDGALPGSPGEQLRHRPLGVVGVIGPFNYPLHLCHAHVVPALLTGNTVVVKPSEVAPLAAQRYAQCALEAGLPPGVLNVVQGGGESGAALADHPAVRGLCFTGSYRVGRALTERLLDRPEVLLALEMGGKNTVVVLDDADLRQAAHEIVVGGYLTTGQRCTATDRVLVQESRAAELVDILIPLIEGLRFGAPDDEQSFAGPLATERGRQSFEAAIAAARAAGAEALVVGARLPGGSFHSASLHRLPDGVHEAAGYTDVEVFGPDVCVEVISGDDEAIRVMRACPYGLANSVFTADSSRFERFYRETHSGILNRNRSTNLASPRLPFGGVGRSGNYRPAGSYAPRNVVLPMAVQENVLGTVQTHPLLADSLPAHDLDYLSRRHAAEEAIEAERNLLDTPRPMRLLRPAGGSLPASDGWLTRLYAGERIVREKKPGVFDHLRSAGPWFVSVDEPPLSVLDGMSQTATVCAGFAEDPVVQAYFEGGFGATLVQTADTAAGPTEQAQAFADVLRHLVPGLPEVTFTNSGAEACEKALALCRLHAPEKATRVLSFEGSFHGRTLVALHATHSPAKRGPFEIAGYESEFVPFPVWNRPQDEEPAAPAGFYACAAGGEIAEMQTRFGDPAADPLLAAEVASLARVHRALRTGTFFATIVEPMQSEGGDRYATARFFRALRLLTRYHRVALVLDEVQTGFGLTGPFAMHLGFRLVNHRGQPDYPDAVTFAKRAQVGVVMSAFPDPEPTDAHPASLVRGRIHAEMMSTSHSAERIEKLVRPLLDGITAAFPHLVGNPRGRGYAFAFDLPGPEQLQAYLGQRFWRGAIVFGAGTRTVRYRLSESYHGREVRMLFDMVRRSLSWLDAHPNKLPPAWEDEAERPRAAPEPFECAISVVGPDDDDLALLPAILDIEYQTYEPARRTPPAEIKAALVHPESVVVIAEVRDGDDWQLVGFGIGAPLEACTLDEGPDRDVMLGKENTLYSVSLTVATDYQGRGLGRAMKLAMLEEASDRKRPDGTPRFRHVTSRNRVGYTAAMSHLNRALGAHTVCVLTGQYDDPEGQAVYGRIPLPPLSPETAARAADSELELSSGIVRPLATPPESLLAAERSGGLYGPAVNKLTLTNYVTPAVVRALEWVGALLPELPHLYLTSCRDEMVDKALRILRWHRKEASVAIGFEGGYLGHTTGAARSLSDPAVHAQGPAHFAWPLVPHPASAGTDATMAALHAAIERAGADRVFAIFYEVVGERTGKVFPAELWPELDRLRSETGVPLVAMETSTAVYRSGLGAFASAALPLRPDLLCWWGGAQTGYLHVSSRYRVAQPLAMVSTWDGDELSLVREHHQLRAARTVDLEAGVAALDAAMALAIEHGATGGGLGLYRVLDVGERAPALVTALLQHGLRARWLGGRYLVVAPPLDRAAEAGERLRAALAEVLT